MRVLKASMEELMKDETKVVLCRRCGQALTDPISIRLGIGPVCREKEIVEGEGEVDGQDPS